MEGLTDIVTQTYNQLRCRGGLFAKQVPHCAFAYYCAVVSSSKVLKVKEKSGALNFSEQEFLRLVGMLDLVAPRTQTTELNPVMRFLCKQSKSV